MVGLLEFVKVALDGGVDAFDEFDFGEAAGRAVDCLDEGAVDGNEFFAEEAIGTAALREVAAGFEPESGQIKTIDEGINGSHRAGRRDIVVNRRRQEHGLATVGSCDVLRHARKFGFPN